MPPSAVSASTPRSFGTVPSPGRNRRRTMARRVLCVCKRTSRIRKAATRRSWMPPFSASSTATRRSGPPAIAAGPRPAKGMAAALEIERDIASADEDAVVLERQYFSQSIDACAMEADNGNVWYDQASATLHVLVSTQSPYEGVTAVAEMLAHTNFRVDQIDFNIGHTVGYGTKDQSVFPYFCILAGLYGGRRPVRLANDRFEQFQMGMKQHSFRMDNTLVADRRSGKFRIVKAEFKMDGGGRANVSANVGMAGTSQALSIYHVPKSDLSFAALASQAVEAGSTRGYGSLQTIMGIELLVDEAAEALGIDPIELRLRKLKFEAENPGRHDEVG